VNGRSARLCPLQEHHIALLLRTRQAREETTVRCRPSICRLTLMCRQEDCPMEFRTAIEIRAPSPILRRNSVLQPRAALSLGGRLGYRRRDARR
jgi:hypothetical protein